VTQRRQSLLGVQGHNQLVYGGHTPVTNSSVRGSFKASILTLWNMHVSFILAQRDFHAGLAIMSDYHSALSVVSKTC
jgi:hypothetical protein